jgi:cytosine/adenosine deaminase-related metal-dependent hydrolase
MSDHPPCRAIRARLVVPVSSPPLDGGIVSVRGARIEAVGANTSSQPPLDLGDVALLPGLINAHTHLEFSELPAPLGYRGMPLPDWIELVVSLRRAHALRSDAVLSTARQGQAIRGGLVECLRGGATRVADIVTCQQATWRDALGADSRVLPHLVGLRELIGLLPTRVTSQLEVARDFLAASSAGLARCSAGLSPHAPYTAAATLVRQAVELSRQAQAVVAMHIAESTEELQLLQQGVGPFRQLLERYGAWDAAVFPGRQRPTEFVRLLASAHRALVVHGNYLGAEDWEILSRHRSGMSVVYCPRTHDYFAHAPYPLQAMLREGVRVVLGTDGRGSNPDASIFGELQFAAGQHPQVPLATWLRMATLDAAAALDCAQDAGSLEVGKYADFTVVDLSRVPPGSRRTLASLTDPAARVQEVWIAGEPCVASRSSDVGP